MKKWILPTSIGVGLLSTLYIIKSFFSSKKPDYSKLPAPKSILFVGDSYTAPAFTYPDYIKMKMPDLTIEKLAKGGMRTDWMLQNLTEKLKTAKYDRVYIWGGANDAFSMVTNQAAFNNIQKMIDLIRSKGSIPFVIIGFKTEPFMDYRKMTPNIYTTTKEGFIPYIKKYGQQQELMKGLKNTYFVPQFDLGTMTIDGCHPTPAAHQIVADHVIKTF
jgi:lysophospholipase L1-like esterase